MKLQESQVKAVAHWYGLQTLHNSKNNPELAELTHKDIEIFESVLIEELMKLSYCKDHHVIDTSVRPTYNKALVAALTLATKVPAGEWVDYNYLPDDSVINMAANGDISINNKKFMYLRDIESYKSDVKQELLERFSDEYSKKYLPLKDFAGKLSVPTNLTPTFNDYLDNYLENYGEYLSILMADKLLKTFPLFTESLSSIVARKAQDELVGDDINAKLDLLKTKNTDAICKAIKVQELPILLAILADKNPQDKANYEKLGQQVYQAIYDQSKLLSFIAHGHKQWSQEHPSLKSLVGIIVSILKLFTRQQSLDNAVVKRDYSLADEYNLEGKEVSSISKVRASQLKTTFFYPVQAAKDCDKKLSGQVKDTDIALREGVQLLISRS